MRQWLLCLTVASILGCNADRAEPATPAPDAASAPAPAADPVASTPMPATPAPAMPIEPTPSDAADPSSVLTGKTWRVERSDTVEVGSTYAFHADGTLVVDGPNGTPMTGKWSVKDGALTMTEEGIDYPTDLAVRDAEHITLRSHNPGGVVEFALAQVGSAP